MGKPFIILLVVHTVSWLAIKDGKSGVLGYIEDGIEDGRDWLRLAKKYKTRVVLMADKKNQYLIPLLKDEVNQEKYLSKSDSSATQMGNLPPELNTSCC